MNTTFRMCPWADALFAMDAAWWDVHAKEVAAVFRGERFTSSPRCRKHGLAPVKVACRNSGAGAIELAQLLGAARAILLGFDLQKTDGKAHWHGDHPKGLGNAGSLHRWPKQFAEMAKRLRIPVVNASRATALASFPRVPLEEALCAS